MAASTTVPETSTSPSSLPALAGDRLASLSAFGPTISRVGLGIVFLAHAYAKAALFTFAGTEAFFTAHGFPGWTVYPVFAGEVLGGLALITGFRVRAASIALIPIMLGAIVPHVKNGFWFTSPNGGWEYPAFLVLALFAQALAGAGALSASSLWGNTATNR